MPKSPDHFKNDAAMLVRPVDEAFQNELAEKIKAAMSAQAVVCGKPMGGDSALQWVASDLLALVQQHEATIAEQGTTISVLDGDLQNAKCDLAAAQAELAKAQETIQQQARELEEAENALIQALPWDPKARAHPYECAWVRSRQPESNSGPLPCDCWVSKAEAALARHSARAQQAEAKKEK